MTVGAEQVNVADSPRGVGRTRKATGPDETYASAPLTEPQSREQRGQTPDVDGLPAVTVDVVILTVRDGRLEVLLVRRSREPFEGYWATPGGFVLPDESLEDAAKRKFTEVTGARDVYLEQLYTFGAPNRDPRMRVITVVYYALAQLDQLDHTRLGTGDAQLWEAYDVPQLAFDHNEILQVTLQRLSGKLEYTTLGFQLLAPEFTLSELQEVYEAILNRSLDKRNFRKKLLLTRILEPTLHTKMVGQHRPARLYRFNPRAAT